MNHVRVGDGAGVPGRLAYAEDRVRSEQLLVFLRVAGVVFDYRALHKVDVLAPVLVVVLRVGRVAAWVAVHNPQHALRGVSGYLYKATRFGRGEGRGQEGGRGTWPVDWSAQRRHAARRPTADQPRDQSHRHGK